MKHYKVKLPYDAIKREHVYPNDWANLLGNHNLAHVYYDDPVDGVFTLLITVSDDHIIKDIPNITEVNETVALEVADLYDPAQERVNDEGKIRRLELKAALGQELTADEMKAIDPDDPTPGFVRKGGTAEKIRNLKILRKV